MTLEELKAEIDELKESSKWHTMQIGILDAQICAMQKQQPKLERWKPEKGEGYFFISSGGQTNRLTNTDHNNVGGYFGYRWFSFNCFPTEEEAQQEAIRTRARRKLEWYARELNANAVGERVWYITYNSLIKWESLNACSLGVIYFHSKESAEYALSQMTAEELEALR